MGAFINIAFYDDYHNPWAIDIYDRDYAGTPVTGIRTNKGSIVITDDGSENNPFHQIYTKKLTFSIPMYITDYTTPQREAILDFYLGLSTSQEGRYYVMVKTGSYIKFIGKILADTGELTLNYHKDFVVNATDGMLQLQEIEYRPEDYDDKLPLILTKISTFKTHFTDIMKHNDVCEFFYAEPDAIIDEPLFTTSTHWTHTGITGDVFEKLAKKNDYFDTEDQFLLAPKTYRKYYSCYDALTDLLTGFCMRMYFSGTGWHIESIPYQDNLTVVRYGHNYDGSSTGNIGNKTTHNINTDDDMYLLADPSLKWMAPLKAVTLKQNKKYLNLLAGLNMWYHRTDTDNRGPHNLGYTLGEGLQLVMELRFDIESTMPTFPNNDLGIEFEMEIKIGTSYLKNNPITHNYLDWEDNTFKTFKTKELQWTSTPSTFKIFFGSGYLALYSQGGNNTYYQQAVKYILEIPITFLTDDIPVNGDFVFRIVNFRAVNNKFEPNPSLDTHLVKWTIDKRSKIYIVSNGLEGLKKVPDDTIIYEVGDSRNSLIYPSKLRYFDVSGNNLTNLHGLWIYNGPGDYTFTQEWTDADAGVTLPIQELMIKTILAHRKIPTEVIRCILEHKNKVLHMSDRYALSGRLCIPLRMVHNVDSGNYQISLWSPYKDYDGDNITKFTDQYDLLVRPPVIGDPQTESRSSSIFYRRFDGITGDNVEITDDALEYYIPSWYGPDEIGARFDITVDGVYVKYKDRDDITLPPVAGDLTPAEWSVDVDNNKFYFGLLENSTIIIKAIL